MIKFKNIDVVGWEHAIRGMRNPMNSWEKSDSLFHLMVDDDRPEDFIGQNDLKLMTKLSKAGNDHGKFLRQIIVYMDILAPLYWWKEFDTYKVGTVANSCSTMHKIQAKEFTIDDFSCEHLQNLKGYKSTKTGFEVALFETTFRNIIDSLNSARKLYLQTGDKQYWWQMIQLLPSSYNQLRTVSLNYQVLKNMYHARKNHKLDEWINFCKTVEKLPCFEELIK